MSNRREIFDSGTNSCENLYQKFMLSNILKTFRERKAQNLVTARIDIKGMTCKNCVRTIKKALFTRPGVKQVFIDLKTGIASVTYDANQTNVPTLHQIIVRKGYFPAVPAEAA
jgi:copper chaperone CopZ